MNEREREKEQNDGVRFITKQKQIITIHMIVESVKQIYEIEKKKSNGIKSISI